jgi:hypothetical protein
LINPARPDDFTAGRGITGILYVIMKATQCVQTLRDDKKHMDKISKTVEKVLIKIENELKDELKIMENE